MTTTFIQGNCIKLINNIDDFSVDLAILDPPYEMKIKDLKILKDSLKKKLNKNATIWVFGRFKYIAEIKILFSETFEFINWVIWHKGTRGSSTKRFTNSHDDILMFTNSKEYTFNLDEIREPYDKSAIEWYERYGGVYDYKKVSRLNSYGKNPTDVWKINFLQGKSKEYENHPHQKPIELIERIIKVSSNMGDNVLDCFMGSGTIGVVCVKLNRNFIGIEKDKFILNNAKGRIERAHDFTTNVGI